MKIKSFLQNLIKVNIFYILANVLIFVLIIVNVGIGIRENLSYDNKIKILKVELTQLEKKVNLMRQIIPSTEKLDEDLKFLNILIPNVEDYFSIIYSLEKLSKKSNFIVSEYNVNPGNFSNEKLKLVVIGSGDSQSFINFLKNYNFGGGRLITSDRIAIDPNYFGSIKVDLTFYSKSVPIGTSLEQIADYKFFQELEDLKSRINFNFDNNSATSSPDLNYPKKSNLF